MQAGYRYTHWYTRFTHWCTSSTSSRYTSSDYWEIGERIRIQEGYRYTPWYTRYSRYTRCTCNTRSRYSSNTSSR